jgi:CRISPR-associated protein Cas5
MDYFDLADDIKIDDFREINYFDDLWSRSYRRADSSKHINGCRYMDATMVDKWNRIKDLVEKDEKRKSKDKNSLLDKLFNRYIGKFPQYYSTPTVREYVDFNGVYLVPLKMDKSLYDMLSYEISNNNIGYLGNSEGWVNLKLTRL